MIGPDVDCTQHEKTIDLTTFRAIKGFIHSISILNEVCQTIYITHMKLIIDTIPILFPNTLRADGTLKNSRFLFRGIKNELEIKVLNYVVACEAIEQINRETTDFNPITFENNITEHLMLGISNPDLSTEIGYVLDVLEMWHDNVLLVKLINKYAKLSEEETFVLDNVVNNAKLLYQCLRFVTKK